MSNAIKTLVAAVLLLGASFCLAQTTNYCVVPINAGATPPYTDWPTAATNIQEVLGRSLAGDTIYLTNGHYYLTGEVAVAKAVIIKSYNNGLTDPTNTIIDGNNYPGKPVTNRCFNVTVGATFDGLTVANGWSRAAAGGGFSISGSGSSLITNCIITGNSAGTSGGGISASRPVILVNCRIVSNSAATADGGVGFASTGCSIKDSLFGWNIASNGNGAAIDCIGNTTIRGCQIVSNKSDSSILYFDGVDVVVSNCLFSGNTNGMVLKFGTTSGPSNLIVNCQIVGNYGTTNPGVTVFCPTVCQLWRGIIFRNCLIADNWSQEYFGHIWVGSANTTGTVESCTIVNNTGKTFSGLYIQPSQGHFFYNTIISSNSHGGVYSDLSFYDAGATDTTNRFFNSCCPTVALPTGQGNFKGDPKFVAVSAGNYRLAADSPCVDTGTNMYWMINAIDLEGRSRLDKLTGLPDMGAYESLHNITLISGF